jgi:hypothetical protein
MPGRSSLFNPTSTSAPNSRLPISETMSSSASSCDSIRTSVRPACVSQSAYSRAVAAPPRQEIHDIRSANSPFDLAARVMSLTATAPPGLSTRTNSLAALGLSGNVHKAHSQMIASTDASASGSCSASPTVKISRFANGKSAASARARVMFCALKSMPVTLQPKRRARTNALVPRPAATSSRWLSGVRRNNSPSRSVSVDPPG